MKTKVANPLDRQYIQGKRKAFERVAKSVDPVARDTNKTRRKQTILPLKGRKGKKAR